MLSFWRGLLGQNVIELADLGAVSETIALTVGLGEDAISLNDGLADLADVGSDAGAGRLEGARRDRLVAAPALISVALDDLDGPGGNIRL